MTTLMDLLENSNHIIPSANIRFVQNADFLNEVDFVIRQQYLDQATNNIKAGVGYEGVGLRRVYGKDALLMCNKEYFKGIHTSLFFLISDSAPALFVREASNSFESKTRSLFLASERWLEFVNNDLMGLFSFYNKKKEFTRSFSSLSNVVFCDAFGNAGDLSNVGQHFSISFEILNYLRGLKENLPENPSLLSEHRKIIASFYK